MASPRPSQEVFAAVLREIRSRKGWSQMRLSSESGVHLAYLSGLERGRHNPSLDVVVRLVRAAGLTMDEFGRLYEEGAHER